MGKVRGKSDKTRPRLPVQVCCVVSLCNLDNSFFACVLSNLQLSTVKYAGVYLSCVSVSKLRLEPAAIFTLQVWPGPVHFVDFLSSNGTAFWADQLTTLYSKVPWDGLW